MSESDGAANTTMANTYDALNRLTGTVTTGSQPISYQYGYYPNGNRISTSIGGAGTECDVQRGGRAGQLEHGGEPHLLVQRQRQRDEEQNPA